MKHRGYFPAQGFAFNPYLKYPRNEECYCRSGKKYKKCCLSTEPLVLTKEDALKAAVFIAAIRTK